MEDFKLKFVPGPNIDSEKGIFCLNPARLPVTSLLSISVKNLLFNLEWSEGFFYFFWIKEMGFFVPFWSHLFGAKFIWYLQKCVHIADSVWYCIIEEFLILTVAQTVMNNSFTTLLRVSSTTETFLYLFFSLLPFPHFLHSNCLVSGNLLRKLLTWGPVWWSLLSF